ncbi:MAG: hypothetical protein H7A35_01535 [Planctomycetales bacterium]|nr:hypothetical protein [bacterium]UNM08740.1 MAG: hypothetical protein H7A35_01535 [Planctomycetales bacterium]
MRILLRACILLTCLAATWLAGSVQATAAPSNLYFIDDFSGESGTYFYSGQLDERRFGYDKGQYRIDTSGSEAYGQSVLLEDLEEYSVEVSAQLLDSSDKDGGGFGISFNYNERQGGSDFMLFLIYNRGAFAVLRYKDDKTSVVTSPQLTDLVKPGKPVQLGVDNTRGQLTFYINGVEVHSLKETQLTRGGFGMFATRRSLVQYDDFKVFADRPTPKIFKDDFSTDASFYKGSYGEVEYYYRDKRYYINTLDTQYIGLSPFPEKAMNFDLSVDVELVQGEPQGGYGIYIRDWETGGGGFNQFRFLVADGWYAIEQSVEDRPLALSQWTQHSAVRLTGVNRLRVVAQDGKLSFFINGVEVYKHTDDMPHMGDFGLYAAGGVEVAFDNLEFLPLQ